MLNGRLVHVVLMAQISPSRRGSRDMQEMSKKLNSIAPLICGHLERPRIHCLVALEEVNQILHLENRRRAGVLKGLVDECAGEI